LTELEELFEPGRGASFIYERIWRPLEVIGFAQFVAGRKAAFSPGVG
jgi:hypothetical protein